MWNFRTACEQLVDLLYKEAIWWLCQGVAFLLHVIPPSVAPFATQPAVVIDYSNTVERSFLIDITEVAENVACQLRYIPHATQTDSASQTVVVLQIFKQNVFSESFCMWIGLTDFIFLNIPTRKKITQSNVKRMKWS
jgi:hypothetical protein